MTALRARLRRQPLRLALGEIARERHREAVRYCKRLGAPNWQALIAEGYGLSRGLAVADESQRLNSDLRSRHATRSNASDAGRERPRGSESTLRG